MQIDATPPRASERWLRKRALETRQAPVPRSTRPTPPGWLTKLVSDAAPALSPPLSPLTAARVLL